MPSERLRGQLTGSASEVAYAPARAIHPKEWVPRPSRCGWVRRSGGYHGFTGWWANFGRLGVAIA